jgi:predicted dehydrogenase
MKKGIHVASETLPAVTMKECVELCRTAEETGCVYMLEENYAYFPSILKMHEDYQSGAWGEVVYMEGEYVHPMSPKEYALYTPTNTHWRALMPSGYYLSHSLAPLMYVTGATPTAVNARSIYTDAVRIEREDEPVKDVASIMLCTMDNNSLARITGWAKFGGHGNWYRFSCAKACAETLRNNEFRVQVRTNIHEDPIEQYDVSYPYDAELARIFWHNGGDYYIMVDFIDCVQNKREPYLNVYRAAAMAAVGILGWRSSLHNGAEYKIPNFRNEDERKVYENDVLSPFLNEDGERNYPCTKYEAEQFNL